MKNKRHYKKEYRPCFCGCGKMVRQYPSRKRKDYSYLHYYNHLMILKAEHFQKIAIPGGLDEKNPA